MKSCYKHILIAIDLMEGCDEMLKKAQTLGKVLGGKMSLLHVIERDIESEHIYVNQADYEQHVLEAAKSKFDTYQSLINIPKLDQHIEIGRPKLVILDMAKRLNCDLIVVGDHNRHGLQKLLGSTANGVLHHAPCDVFVLRYVKES